MDLVVEPIVPAINVDNFPSILYVICHRFDRIAIYFDSMTSMSEAYLSWTSKHNNSILFWMNPSHNCFGKSQVASFATHSSLIEIDLTSSENILYLKGNVEDPADSFSNFEAQLVSSVKTTETPAASSSNGTEQHNATHAFNLNLNFQNGSVVERVKKVLTTKRVSLECLDCYLSGSLSWSFYFKNRGANLEAYKFDLLGGIQGNLDANIILERNPIEAILIRIRVFTLPIFHPFELYPFFHFGPDLAFDFGLSYALFEDLQIQLGFDFSHTFDYHVSSEHGLAAFPNITHAGAPSINHAHGLKISKDVSANVGIHLIPVLAFRVIILTRQLFSVGLELDNELGVEIRIGNSTDCPRSSKSQYTLFNHHKFGFFLGTYPINIGFNKTFWDSGIHHYPVSKPCPLVIGQNATLPAVDPMNPQVNLTQVLTLQALECKKDTLSLLFASPDSRDEALTMWSPLSYILFSLAANSSDAPDLLVSTTFNSSHLVQMGPSSLFAIGHFV